MRTHQAPGDLPPPSTTGDLLPGARAYCYPNPVGDDTGRATVRFFLTREANVSLRVYDAVGNQMDRIDAQDLRAAADNEVSWPVGGYASGLYLCQLSAIGADGSKGEVTLRMAVSR